MKQETLMRILNLMEQGVITAEEAAALIDALYDTNGSATASTAPTETHENPHAEPTENARSLFEKIARAVEEATQTATEAVRKIDWRALGDTIRNQTQRGLEEMRKALADLERGEWSLGAWGKHHAESQQQMDLPLTTGQTLTVELPVGDVHLLGGFDGGRVEATIHLQGADPNTLQDALRAYSLLVEQRPDGIQISAPELAQSIGQKIDLELRLPREVNLKVEVKHRGDLTVDKIDGMLQLKTQHGDIEVRHASGAIQVETVRGDLTLTDVRAPHLYARAVNGDIHLTQARVEHLQAHLAHGDLCIEESAIRTLKADVVKGDIEVELTEPITDVVHLYTVSGDITLRVPDDNDCTIAMHTVAGDIECALNCHAVQREPHTLRATCGNGTGTLTMETVHGDLCVALRAHPTS